MFKNFFATQPWTLPEIIFTVLAAIGVILLVYGVYLECERRQDITFTIGALCLMAYAIFIGNKVFMIAMGAFALACFVEYVEILLGRHEHSTELVEQYKNPKN